MYRKTASLLTLLLLACGPAMADEFLPISEQSDFVQLVSGKHLTRVGIKLAVSPSGDIRGSAFGVPVSGAWNWNGGYFCRDLFYGAESLGQNCQAVLVSGDTLRFISDQGNGDWADLRIR